MKLFPFPEARATTTTTKWAADLRPTVCFTDGQQQIADRKVVAGYVSDVNAVTGGLNQEIATAQFIISCGDRLADRKCDCSIFILLSGPFVGRGDNLVCCCVVGAAEPEVS